MMDNKIKKIYNDIINDKKKLLIICGVIIFVLVLIVVFFNKGSQGLLVSSDGEKFKTEYERYNGVLSEDGKKYLDVNIESAEKIRYTDEDEILDIFNNFGDAVIYFGYPTCAYCRSAIQVLYDTTKDTELQTIYYLDVEDGVDSKLIEAMDDKFLVEKDGLKIINSPLVLFVVQGEVVSHNIGTLFSQEDPYVALDNSQVEGLGLIYKYGINDVLTSIRLKSINPVELSENENQ